jgi:hypothetical protein
MVVATPIASVGDRHTEAVAYLRGVLHTVVDNRSGADAVDRIGWRTGAVLYLLLRDHPINRWGRCRSCRYTGTIIGFRRRHCRVHITTNYWLLRQPDEVLLLSHLADELQLASGCGHLGRAPRPARRRKWRKRGDAGSIHDAGQPDDDHRVGRGEQRLVAPEVDVPAYVPVETQSGGRQSRCLTPPARIVDSGR